VRLISSGRQLSKLPSSTRPYKKDKASLSMRGHVSQAVFVNRWATWPSATHEALRRWGEDCQSAIILREFAVKCCSFRYIFKFQLPEFPCQSNPTLKWQQNCSCNDFVDQSQYCCQIVRIIGTLYRQVV
jgi:hypothetical protein